jgi:MFS family permease
MDTELSSGPMFEQIRAGFSYVLQTPIIFMLLGCNFLMAFFGMTYYMLLPGFVKEVLNAGPDKLGLIMSIAGFGSLAGSLAIASLPGRNRAKVLLSGTLLMGVALLLFSLSTHYWFSLALLTLVGLGSSARMSLSNVLIQTHVDDSFRGRVMSIHMLEMAVISIGIFPVSVFADIFGPQWAVGLSAFCLIILVLFLFTRPAYRDLD